MTKIATSARTRMEPLPHIDGYGAQTASDSEALTSIAISLKRIADALEGVSLDGFKNQLLDIAYQAGVNFRGQA